MIRLHCTQKLLAKLPLDASGRLQSKVHQAEAANDASESPLSGWHALLVSQAALGVSSGGLAISSGGYEGAKALLDKV